MESGEEQHFLRGKPAFRAQTLFQAPQTGNALSPIYVFHPVRRKHECRKTGAHVIGCVSDNTHSTHARQRGGLITDKWAKTSQGAAIARRSQCLPAVTDLFSWRSRDKTTRRRGPSSINEPLHWPPLTSHSSFLSAACQHRWQEGFKKNTGRRRALSYSPSHCLPRSLAPS